MASAPALEFAQAAQLQRGDVDDLAEVEARRLVAVVERGKARGSSYWDVPLKKVGIDPARVRELAENPGEPIMQQLR